MVGFALHNATEGFGIVGPLAAADVRASWGWLGPSYTESFLAICRPSRLLGSIPLIARSTANFGRSDISRP